MHYLKCIALLNYLLKKLYAGQRVQVPVSVLPEIQTTLVSTSKILEIDGESAGVLRIQIQDILEAISVANDMTGLMYITDNLKKILVDGVTSVRREISVKAFHYFEVNDFEPTEEIIPVMRTVVEDAIKKGVIQ